MSKNIKVDSRGREQIPHWYAIGITTNKEKIIRSKVQELIKQKIWKDQIFNIVLPTKIEKDAKGKDKEAQKILEAIRGQLATHVVEVEFDATPKEQKELNTILEHARIIRNTALGQAYKRYEQMIRTKKYRKLLQQ